MELTDEVSRVPGGEPVSALAVLGTPSGSSCRPLGRCCGRPPRSRCSASVWPRCRVRPPTAAAPLPPEKAATGVAVFGVPVLMVLAAMTVTGEYRSGMIRTTFMATPNRTLVLVAKAVVAALFFGCLRGRDDDRRGGGRRGWSPLRSSARSCRSTDPDTWRLDRRDHAVRGARRGARGRGRALLRHSAGAVAVLLLWPLLVEPVLGNLPSIGSEVGPYLPFANVFRFIDVQWLYPGYAMPWGEFGSLVYFARSSRWCSPRRSSW